MLLNIQITISCFICASVSLNIRLLHQHALPHLSGASALEVYRNTLYVAGDNVNSLLTLDPSLKPLQYHSINTTSVDTRTLSKAEKSDWEASLIAEREGEAYLFVFGSGSSAKRMQLSVAPLQGKWEPVMYSLAELYTVACATQQISESELNIEAATLIQDSLILFNRATNSLYQYDLEEFWQYLNGATAVPHPQVYTYTLPSIEAWESRFSGACTLNAHTIAFTASVEQTDNSIDDGSIFGSFVGLLPFPLQSADPTCTLFCKQEQVLPVKLESIAVLQENHPEYRIILACDNDDAGSELFEALLTVAL